MLTTTELIVLSDIVSQEILKGKKLNDILNELFNSYRNIDDNDKKYIIKIIKDRVNHNQP